MKRTFGLFIVALISLWLLACALIPQPTVDIPPPVPWQGDPKTAEPEPTATSQPVEDTTPLPTPTLLPTWTPTPPHEPLEAPGEGYRMVEEHAIGDYLVQLWHPVASDFGYEDVGVIVRDDQILARVDQVFGLGAETGEDLTGEGHPDVLFHVFTGGAHCCFSSVLYDLGTEVRLVLRTPLSNCGGEFKDLDDDGTREFLTCDDLFAYAYCTYAFSPAVRVVLAYDPELGYVPVSPQFTDLYEQDLTLHAGLPGECIECGWDGTDKCGVLPLVLDYLYTDRPSEAWQALEQLYDEPDQVLFWADVVQAVQRSPFYAPGSNPIDLHAPPYYTLQLLTACPSSTSEIGIAGEGQDACAPDVPHRDLYWLEAQLWAVELLAEDEMLVLGPEGCTSDCHLDILRTSDDTRVGSIRLDTTGGFPGQVYRVNGQEEGTHWRLRGDLTWESLP